MEGPWKKENMHRAVKLRILFFGLSLVFVFMALSAADENRWSTNGPSGGSVITIAVNPFDTDIIYAGTIQNGIYKSTDGGDSWTWLESYELNPTMRVVAIHPTAPDTVYAATVGGVFKSANGGANWIALPLPQNEFRAFLIHPVYPQVLFAGGVTDRWKSTDGGQNWYRLNLERLVGIDHFACDPQNADVLYFTSGSMRYGLGIWKSEDMGESWYSIQNNLDSTGFGEEVAVDPVDSDVLYLTRNDYLQQSGHCVSKSTDGGASWFDITPPGLAIPIVFAVRVSPFDHNTVFICTSHEGVFKSADGGQSWESSSEGLNVPKTETLEFDVTTGTILLGTYSDGIHKSTDGGQSWQKISDNINLSACRDIAMHENAPDVIYLKSIVLYRSFDGGFTWRYLDPGIPDLHMPMAIEIDKFSENILYLATGHAFPQIPVGNTGFYRSTDSGESWEFFDTGLRGDIQYFDIDVSYSNDGARRIFLASYRGLYYSDDDGETWMLCGNGLPTDEFFYKLDVAPGNQDIIGVGIPNDNEIFISIDKGDTWARAGDIPYGDWFSDIEFDPSDEDIIYVSSADAGLFKSIDGGVSWSNINNNIPLGDYISVSGLAINPLNPENLIVCSSRRGVYQSHDGGDSWESFNMGLDTVIIAGQLSFVPGDTNTVFFASGNKSVWSITRTTTDITDENIFLPTEIRLYNYPNPLNATTLLSYSLPLSGPVKITIYNLLGQQVAMLFEGTQQAGEYTTAWDAAAFPSGVYFARLKTLKSSQSIKMVLLK